jgi:hypothetical protein
MSERIIQAMPAHDDEVVLRHCYPIRVQNAIIQNSISDGLTLTATGRLSQASVIQILEDIQPIMGLGRELKNPERKHESDVYKLEELRNSLIALGVVKVANGKLRVLDDAEIGPTQLFNQQLLPQVTAILTHATPMFTRLRFRPFVDFMAAIAAGQDATAALRSVAEHIRSPPQQASVHSTVIFPQILKPLLDIGLLVHNPFRTTGLWDEVISFT